jgi:hypothetical protein
MTVKIGWVQTFESELLSKYGGLSISPYIFFDPENYKRIPTVKESRWNFSVCPAFLQFNKNLFVLKSPVDFGFTVAPKNNNQIDGNWELYPAEGHQNDIAPEAVRKLISYNSDSSDKVDYDKPVFQFRFNYVFFADEPVTIQMMPSIYENKDIPVNTIPGEFNIYDWQRPLQWGFEWQDTKKPLIIKRGDPVCYIKFIVHKDPREKVELVKLKMTTQIEKAIYKTSETPLFVKNTFKLFEKARLMRPKKFITEDNIWKPGE